MPDASMCRLKRTGHDLQQSRLTAAVGTDNPSRCPCFDFKVDVFEGPKLLMSFPTTARKHLLQAIIWPLVDTIALGNTFNAQCSGHGGNDNCSGRSRKGSPKFDPGATMLTSRSNPLLMRLKLIRCLKTPL